MYIELRDFPMTKIRTSSGGETLSDYFERKTSTCKSLRRNLSNPPRISPYGRNDKGSSAKERHCKEKYEKRVAVFTDRAFSMDG